MFKKMIATTFMLCLFGLNGHATPLSFKHHVIFGDSLTDVGNYTTSSNNCICNCSYPFAAARQTGMRGKLVSAIQQYPQLMPY